jgi:hypothetical protein
MALSIESPAPGPGPRGASGIVKETFRLYGRCVVPLTLIAAAVTIPLVLAGTAAFGPAYASLTSGVPTTTPQLPDTMLGTLAGYALLHLLGMLAASGALMEASARRLAGSAISITRAYGIAIRRLPAMLGAGLIVALVVGIPTGLMFTLPTTFTAAGFVLLVPIAMLVMYLLVRLMFVGYAALLEHAGPLAAVERSWNLVSGSWRRTFRLTVLISLCVFAVQLAFELTIGTSAAPGAILATLVVTPLTVIGNLLIYLDLRARKESYTAAQMTQELHTLESPTVT